MPDIHWGYGFCIGGVCATDPAEGGVISPGGVGYDINCGVRLLRTNLTRDDVQPRLQGLMDALFRRIPAGVGRGGPYLFGPKELRRLLADGLPLPEHRGLATDGDLEHTEAGGCLAGAEPDCGQPSGHRARRRPVRHARLGQPFPRSAGGRRGLRRTGRTRHGAAKGRGLRDDPLRLARAGLPGVRRRPEGFPQRAGEVRHRPARPATRLRPRAQPRGAEIPGGDARGGQFRLGEPAIAHAADPRGLRRVLRPPLGSDADEPRLRRRPQHREDGRTTSAATS